MALSWACATGWCDFHSLAIASVTLHSDHHDPLSHCHVPCSLASPAFLRFSPWARFWSLTCTTCTHSVVFDCLNSSQKYFFSPVYSILELNIELYSQILSLMIFFLWALSLILKRASKQVLKYVLKVHMLSPTSTSSTSKPIGSIKIFENIFLWKSWESFLVLISGSSLIVVSPFNIVWQYLVCTTIKKYRYLLISENLFLASADVLLSGWCYWASL